MDTEKLSQGVENTLNNQYFFWSLMLFAIVFGWLARPPLPNWLLRLFENPVFQYIVLFGVVYTGSKDLKASIWAPLIFMGIMFLLSYTESDRQKEGFYSNAASHYSEPFQTDADVEDDAPEETESEAESVDDVPAVEEDREDREDREGEGEEGFVDGNSTDVERVKYAKKLKRGLSDLKDQTEDLYTTATSLVDSYPDKNSVTEGFYDYAAASSCGCI